LEPKFKQLRDGAFVSLGEYWAHIDIIVYWGDNVELFMRTYIASLTEPNLVFKEEAIMNIITDISIIEDLASKRQEENWRFRSYLKVADIAGSRIDTAVQMLTRWISKQIDCGKCANCCKACSPILQMPDIQ